MAANDAGGALADFARRPPREKAMIFGVIALLLGLLYWQFMLRPLQKKYAREQVQNKTLIDDGETLSMQLEQFKDLSTTQISLNRQIEQDRKALPTEAELPAFFETLNGKVGDAGVEVRKWEYKREAKVDDFYRVPIEIELTGTWNQIKKFFVSLVPRDDSGAAGDLPKEQERIITIENLSIADALVKNGEILLTAKFTASTFRQDEKKPDPPPPGTAPAATPAAPAAGSAAAPKPGSGSAGSGSGSAGSGSAGSGSGAKGSGAGGLPGEVKREVQGSVDDAAKRERDAAGKLKGGL